MNKKVIEVKSFYGKEEFEKLFYDFIRLIVSSKAISSETLQETLKDNI